MDIKWIDWQLPNIPLYRTKLDDEMMDYLWSCIRQAEKDNVDNSNDYSHRLAGNISGSLGLTDRDDYFLNNVSGPLTGRIIREDPKHFAPPIAIELKDKYEPKLTMNWWVNYQYQTEFNPSHAHAGITSFVIWMKIPTRAEEQHNLPFHSSAASDFQFTYTNILGGVTELPIDMDPEMEGTMMVFPSSLHHQVHPFYNTDESRISIAGNLIWSMVELQQD
jgi:hypothetical protein|tara:strand:- start:139 stop:798 length:660 start_codon:yes stop_codon:yes gene_type:complete